MNNYKLVKILNVYMDNNTQSNLTQILDYHIDAIHSAVNQMLFTLNKRYSHYLKKEIFESALIVKRKINRLNNLLKIIQKPVDII